MGKEPTESKSGDGAIAEIRQGLLALGMLYLNIEHLYFYLQSKMIHIFRHEQFNILDIIFYIAHRQLNYFYQILKKILNPVKVVDCAIFVLSMNVC